MSRAVDRVLDIFETLSEEPRGLSLSELARRVGAPKGSLHPIVRSLLARDYLTRQGTRDDRGGDRSDANGRSDRDGSNGRAGGGALRLGMRLWSIGATYVDDVDLVAMARPVMRQLADSLNESLQLAVLEGIHNVYVAREDSEQPVRLVSRLGRRLHAHATGLGKVLLAGLPNAEVRRRFGDGPLPRFTPNTVPTLDALCEELARVRTRRYAVDDEEYTPGIRCIAVPIRDHTGAVVAAMSVSVPAFRFSPKLRHRALALLPTAAEEISRQLGWLPHRPARRNEAASAAFPVAIA